MLSQTGVYAIRAMGCLVSESEKDDKPVLGRTIAEKMQIPSNFLSKILNRLVQAGLIRSVRGKSGGFNLAKPSSEITLREIVDLFMPSNDYKNCLLGLNKCNGGCGLHHRWKNITEQYNLMLSETTIDKIF
ncbi:MAG: Rrf2 family transcriptional regulator [Syntrophales bacterium]|nr:Rrf2 family transcriptional regulator [Syntrophales bacterium]